MRDPLIIAGATGYGVRSANSLQGARATLAAPVARLAIGVQLTLDIDRLDGPESPSAFYRPALC
jgi:hypothetical protein